MISFGAEDVRPDAVTFISLLNACKHGGLVEKGHAYFELMINTYNIEPRIKHYGCLINPLGRAGKFGEALEVINGMKMELDEDEARNVRKKLKEQNAYKILGCSWIEVDSQVHQFSSVDKTHPRTDEIYNILESMVSLY
ncbi:hypothetical protein PTKIN_Ptkin07bG0036600 [Pterospermum kingtungense]